MAIRNALKFAAPLVVLSLAAVAASQPTSSILAWTPEQQASGYKHMERFAPVRRVRRGMNVMPLPTAVRPIEPRISVGGRVLDLADYMRQERVSGVIAIKDGQVILERYGLGRRPTDRWTSFSVAKSVTSTLIGAAIQDGRIHGLDDPVTAYIPQLAGSAYDNVSIRQLITMTSGVKWNEDYSDLDSDVAKVGLAPGEPGMNPVVSYMRHLPRAAPPGERFHYDTGETDLAGILVSNAVGEPLGDYLSKKIWAPFGMEQDALWVEDAAGHERGGCCISMALRDYARFGLFMLGGGVAGGKQVLPPGWVADATRAHVRGANYPPYGYFWWIQPDAYEAEGIFGQAIAVFPADHLVIALNSAWTKADEDQSWRDEYALMLAIRTASRALP